MDLECLGYVCSIAVAPDRHWPFTGIKNALMQTDDSLFLICTFSTNDTTLVINCSQGIPKFCQVRSWLDQEITSR